MQYGIFLPNTTERVVFFLFHQTITSAKVKRMLALVVAQHGPVRDGLVSLLEASPHINKIVQVKEIGAAWDLVQAISPDITLIYVISLTQELSTFITNLNGVCSFPILAIVGSEDDRRMALVAGADVAFLEGVPSSKLANQIEQSIQRYLLAKQ